MTYVYVARVCMGDADTGSVYSLIGRGTTPERAEQDCIRKIGMEILVELAEGVLIPVHELDKMPKITPPDCGLVIFVRTSHNHGGAYNYRYFAIRALCEFTTYDGQRVKVSDGWPTMVSTIDCNGEFTCSLPRGSFEYVDGSWQPSIGVWYNY